MHQWLWYKFYASFSSNVFLEWETRRYDNKIKMIEKKLTDFATVYSCLFLVFNNLLSALFVGTQEKPRDSGFGKRDTRIQMCFPTLRIFKWKEKLKFKWNATNHCVPSIQLPLHIYVVRIWINVNEMNVCIWESEWCSIWLCNAIRFFMHALLYFYCSCYTPMCWSGLLP